MVGRAGAATTKGRSLSCPPSSVTERGRAPAGGINHPTSPEGQEAAPRAAKPAARPRGGGLPEVLPIVLIAACPQLRVVVGRGRSG